MREKSQSVLYTKAETIKFAPNEKALFNAAATKGWNYHKQAIDFSTQIGKIRFGSDHSFQKMLQE